MNNLKDDDSIKSHKEIIQLIDEIRDFEDEDVNYEIDLEKKEDRPIEVEKKQTLEDNDLINEDLKNNFFNRVKNHSTLTKIDDTPIKPTTFNIGFDKNGDLVNLNLKKKNKIKREKGHFKIKNLLKRNKDKRDNNDKQASDSKSKLAFFGKLKNIIPSRSSKKEEKEENLGDEE